MNDPFTIDEQSMYNLNLLMYDFIGVEETLKNFEKDHNIHPILKFAPFTIGDKYDEYVSHEFYYNCLLPLYDSEIKTKFRNIVKEGQVPFTTYCYNIVYFLNSIYEPSKKWLNRGYGDFSGYYMEMIVKTMEGVVFNDLMQYKEFKSYCLIKGAISADFYSGVSAELAKNSKYLKENFDLELREGPMNFLEQIRKLTHIDELKSAFRYDVIERFEYALFKEQYFDPKSMRDIEELQYNMRRSFELKKQQRYRNLDLKFEALLNQTLLNCDNKVSEEEIEEVKWND